ncbi:MAG: hypothetical protein JNM76_13755 [Betaproteobacteria bacterium]|nr:hypothetical protein [Betaproteobacteria bacterium]
MKETAIVLALSVLTSLPLGAVEQYKVAMPAASTLTRAPQARPDDLFVHFRGQVTLHATYRFIYDQDSGYKSNPYLLLMPDEKALKSLPYLTERGRPELANAIFVRNPMEAAKALLNEKLEAELQAGKHQEVSGLATVVIDQFGAGYDCDSPSFVARFVSLEKVVVAAAATPSLGKRGC